MTDSKCNFAMSTTSQSKSPIPRTLPPAEPVTKSQSKSPIPRTLPPAEPVTKSQSKSPIPRTLPTAEPVTKSQLKSPIPRTLPPAEPVTKSQSKSPIPVTTSLFPKRKKNVSKTKLFKIQPSSAKDHECCAEGSPAFLRRYGKTYSPYGNLTPIMRKFGKTYSARGNLKHNDSPSGHSESEKLVVGHSESVGVENAVPIQASMAAVKSYSLKKVSGKNELTCSKKLGGDSEEQNIIELATQNIKLPCDKSTKKMIVLDNSGKPRVTLYLVPNSEATTSTVSNDSSRDGTSAAGGKAPVKYQPVLVDKNCAPGGSIILVDQTMSASLGIVCKDPASERKNTLPVSAGKEDTQTNIVANEISDSDTLDLQLQKSVLGSPKHLNQKDILPVSVSKEVQADLVSNSDTVDLQSQNNVLDVPKSANNLNKETKENSLPAKKTSIPDISANATKFLEPKKSVLKKKVKHLTKPSKVSALSVIKSKSVPHKKCKKLSSAAKEISADTESDWHSLELEHSNSCPKLSISDDMKSTSKENDNCAKFSHAGRPLKKKLIDHAFENDAIVKKKKKKKKGKEKQGKEKQVSRKGGKKPKLKPVPTGPTSLVDLNFDSSLVDDNKNVKKNLKEKKIPERKKVSKKEKPLNSQKKGKISKLEKRIKKSSKKKAKISDLFFSDIAKDGDKVKSLPLPKLEKYVPILPKEKQSATETSEKVAFDGMPVLEDATKMIPLYGDDFQTMPVLQESIKPGTHRTYKLGEHGKMLTQASAKSTQTSLPNFQSHALLKISGKIPQPLGAQQKVLVPLYAAKKDIGHLGSTNTVNIKFVKLDPFKNVSVSTNTCGTDLVLPPPDGIKIGDRDSEEPYLAGPMANKPSLLPKRENTAEHKLVECDALPGLSSTEEAMCEKPALSSTSSMKHESSAVMCVAKNTNSEMLISSINQKKKPKLSKLSTEIKKGKTALSKLSTKAKKRKHKSLELSTDTNMEKPKLPTDTHMEKPKMSKLSTGTSMEKLKLSTGTSTEKPKLSAGTSTEKRKLSAGTSTEKPKLSAGTSTEKLKLSTGTSTEKPKFSAGPSTEKPKLSADTSMEKLKLSTGTSTEKPKVSAGTSTEKPKVSAGTSMEKPKLSAGTSTGKPKLSTGTSTEKPKLSAGTSTGKPKLSAGTSTGKPKLSAGTSTGKPKLSAGTSTGKPKLSAGTSTGKPKLSAGTSTGKPKLSAGTSTERQKLSTSTEKPKLSTGTSTEKPKLSTGTSTEKPKLSADTSTEKPKLSAGTSTEKPKLLAGTSTEKTKLSASTSTEKTKLSASTSMEKPKMSTGTSTGKPKLSAGTSTEKPKLSADTNTEEQKLSAGTSTEKPKLAAGTSTEKPKLSAGTSTEKPKLSTGPSTEKQKLSTGPSPEKQKLSAGPSPEKQKLSTGTSTEKPKLSAGTSTEKPKLSAGTSTEKPKLSADTNTEEQKLSAGTSTEKQKLSADTNTEEQKLSAGTSMEKPKLSTGTSTEEPKLSAGTSTEKPKLTAGTSAEKPKLSTDTSTEKLKLSTEGEKEKGKSSKLSTESQQVSCKPLNLSTEADDVKSSRPNSPSEVEGENSANLSSDAESIKSEPPALLRALKLVKKFVKSTKSDTPKQKRPAKSDISDSPMLKQLSKMKNFTLSSMPITLKTEPIQETSALDTPNIQTAENTTSSPQMSIQTPFLPLVSVSLATTSAPPDSAITTSESQDTKKYVSFQAISTNSTDVLHGICKTSSSNKNENDVMPPTENAPRESTQPHNASLPNSASFSSLSPISVMDPLTNDSATPSKSPSISCSAVSIPLDATPTPAEMDDESSTLHLYLSSPEHDLNTKPRKMCKKRNRRTKSAVQIYFQCGKQIDGKSLSRSRIRQHRYKNCYKKSPSASKTKAKLSKKQYLSSERNLTTDRYGGSCEISTQGQLSCSVCHHSFTHHNKLKVHMRLHLGKKPHKCSLCGKRFRHKAHLLGHMRSHTGKKPYECSICQKSFQSISNLRVHQRLHTGEKPYKCPDCPRKFTQSGHLADHQRKNGHSSSLQIEDLGNLQSQNENNDICDSEKTCLPSVSSSSLCSSASESAKALATARQEKRQSRMRMLQRHLAGEDAADVGIDQANKVASTCNNESQEPVSTLAPKPAENNKDSVKQDQSPVAETVSPSLPQIKIDSQMMASENDHSANEVDMDLKVNQSFSLGIEDFQAFSSVESMLEVHDPNASGMDFVKTEPATETAPSGQELLVSDLPPPLLSPENVSLTSPATLGNETLALPLKVEDPPLLPKVLSFCSFGFNNENLKNFTPGISTLETGSTISNPDKEEASISVPPLCPEISAASSAVDNAEIKVEVFVKEAVPEKDTKEWEDLEKTDLTSDTFHEQERVIFLPTGVQNSSAHSRSLHLVDWPRTIVQCSVEEQPDDIDPIQESKSSSGQSQGTWSVKKESDKTNGKMVSEEIETSEIEKKRKLSVKEENSGMCKYSNREESNILSLTCLESTPPPNLAKKHCPDSEKDQPIKVEALLEEPVEDNQEPYSSSDAVNNTTQGDSVSPLKNISSDQESLDSELQKSKKEIYGMSKRNLSRLPSEPVRFLPKRNYKKPQKYFCDDFDYSISFIPIKPKTSNPVSAITTMGGNSSVTVSRPSESQSASCERSEKINKSNEDCSQDNKTNATYNKINDNVNNNNNNDITNDNDSDSSCKRILNFDSHAEESDEKPNVGSPQRTKRKYDMTKRNMKKEMRVKAEKLSREELTKTFLRLRFNLPDSGEEFELQQQYHKKKLLKNATVKKHTVIPKIAKARKSPQTSPKKCSESHYGLTKMAQADQKPFLSAVTTERKILPAPPKTRREELLENLINYSSANFVTNDEASSNLSQKNFEELDVRTEPTQLSKLLGSPLAVLPSAAAPHPALSPLVTTATTHCETPSVTTIATLIPVTSMQTTDNMPIPVTVLANPLAAVTHLDNNQFFMGNLPAPLQENAVLDQKPVLSQLLPLPEMEIKTEDEGMTDFFPVLRIKKEVVTSDDEGYGGKQSDGLSGLRITGVTGGVTTHDTIPMNSDAICSNAMSVSSLDTDLDTSNHQDWSVTRRRPLRCTLVQTEDGIGRSEFTFECCGLPFSQIPELASHLDSCHK